MKKQIAVILFFAMMLAFAACRGTAETAAEPTSEPAAVSPAPEQTAVPSASPTAELPAGPTAEPTAEPTEAQTPEPTAVPEPTELAFEDCAELVISLPWGNGENEVFFVRPTFVIDDADWVIPQHFNVIDGKVYVLDRYYNYGNGVLECDPGTGGSERISPDIGDYDFFNSEFAMLDGKLIFARYMYDLETGERTELQPITSDYWDYPRDGILIMSVRDGRCFAYKAADKLDIYDDQYVSVIDTQAYDEYELDMENLMWALKRRITMPKNVPHASPDISDGSEFYCYDRYMGTDDAGNHYVDSYECILHYNAEGTYRSSTIWNRIIKLSPEGIPISYVDVYFPDNYIYMWIDDNFLIYKVDGDGTVWYMCETEDEFLVYKISL